MDFVDLIPMVLVIGTFLLIFGSTFLEYARNRFL